MTFNYQAEAEQTNSPHYHATKVPTIHFQNVILGAVACLSDLDDIKKAVFYGRELPQSTLDMFSTETKLDHMFEPESKAMTVPLVHSIIGIATEAGELLEIFDRPEFDRTNFIEEIGDVMWYIAIGLNAVGSTFEEAQRINIAKLRKRYPEKFTEYDANNRDLKAEREVLETPLTFGRSAAWEAGRHASAVGSCATPPYTEDSDSYDDFIAGYTHNEAMKREGKKEAALSATERLILIKNDARRRHILGFDRDFKYCEFELISENEKDVWLKAWDEAERKSAIHLKDIRDQRGGVINPGPVGREHGPEIYNFSKPIYGEGSGKDFAPILTENPNKSFEIDGHHLTFQQAQTYIALKQMNKLGELLDGYQLPL